MKKITISWFEFIAVIITVAFFVVGRDWLRDLFFDKSSVVVPFTSLEYITQDDPEFLFIGNLGNVYEFETSDIISGDDVYRLNMSVSLEGNPKTDRFQSELSLTVEVASSLKKREKLPNRDVYTLVGQTNSMNIAITKLWDGNKYNDLLLEALQRKTYTIVNSEPVKYWLQVQIVSSGLKGSSFFLKDDHFYGSCDLYLECLPGVFSRQEEVLVSPVLAVSPFDSLQSSRIRLGRITVRRKKK